MTPFNREYYMYIDRKTTIIAPNKRKLFKEIIIYYIKKRIIFNKLHNVKKEVF